MSVMFEADNEAALKERHDLAVSRLKELHQEGLPGIHEKTGKPFACFLRSLITKALKGAGESVETDRIPPENEADTLIADHPEITPYIRLLQAETARITDRGLEEDVIRLELILQILGEISCRLEEEEKILTPETFHETLYWFYSDYSETVLAHCLKEAGAGETGFPAGYAKTLPYTPGFLEWGDLADFSVEQEKDRDWLILFDANLATRRLEAYSEAKKKTEEAGYAVRTDFAAASDLCGQNRNYRHFVKRLGEISQG